MQGLIVAISWYWWEWKDSFVTTGCIRGLECGRSPWTWQAS